MTIIKTDICIIGGGSGGLSVASAASQMGAKVVLCEGNKMGGDCLNYGCVPSKALIEASRAANHIKNSHKFGINIHNFDIDFNKINKHVQNVIDTIKPHDSVERFESLGVNVIQEYAEFIDSKTVRAGKYIIKAKYFVISTGSRPNIFNIDGLNDISYFTNETIFDLKQKPDNLVVIGGGPIGVEIAEAYALLGSKVTIIEFASSILGMVDDDCKNVILNIFNNLDINIITSAQVISFSKENMQTNITYMCNDKKQTISCSHVFMVTGRKPNIERLSLNTANISHTKAGVVVDKRLRTNKKHVFAIGDIASHYQFTHTAGM